MNFIIKKTEPGLFTVGTQENGYWQSFEDFNSREKAKQWIIDQNRPGKIHEIILDEMIPGHSPGKKIIQENGVFKVVNISAFESQKDGVIASFCYADQLIRYLYNEYYKRPDQIDGNINTYGY